MRYTMLLLIVGFLSGCLETKSFWDTPPTQFSIKNEQQRMAFYNCKAVPKKVYNDIISGLVPYPNFPTTSDYDKKTLESAKRGPNGRSHFISAETTDNGVSEFRRKVLERYKFTPAMCIKVHCHPSLTDMSFWEDGTAAAVKKINACSKKRADKNKALEKVAEQVVMQGRSDTCKSYGFKVNTDAHSQCMFDLFKLEKSALESKKLQEAMVTEAQRLAEVAREKRRNNAFIDSMLLLQQSSQYTSPVPTPTVRCRYNSVMSTMTCN